MTTRHDPYRLPADLPVPVDDGACDHLTNALIPSVMLPATNGLDVRLPPSSGKPTVLYCYPRTGRPGEEPPDGWDAIPGARGCTPQSCAYRDYFQELSSLGADVYGLSTQTSADQREFAQRSHIPFLLLSDHDLRFARALKLPTFEVMGMTLIKRLTLILDGDQIRKVFYPVFPPDRDAQQVTDWLRGAC
jgi:peroxiredoxin